MATPSEISVFDAMVRDSQAWIVELRLETGHDQQRALRSLRSVLHAVRDALAVDEARELAEHLPVLLRGIYYEGWSPSRRPDAAGASAAPVRPEEVQAVLRLLARRLPEQAARLQRLLPQELRAFWPASIAEHVAERGERLAAEKRLSTVEALHEQSGHERGAPLAPKHNRPPGLQHRGGPLPNTM